MSGSRSRGQGPGAGRRQGRRRLLVAGDVRAGAGLLLAGLRGVGRGHGTPLGPLQRRGQLLKRRDETDAVSRRGFCFRTSARRREYDLYSTGALNKNKAPSRSGFNSWINTHVVKINLPSIHVLDCKTQLRAFNLRQKHPPLEEPHSNSENVT